MNIRYSFYNVFLYMLLGNALSLWFNIIGINIAVFESTKDGFFHQIYDVSLGVEHRLNAVHYLRFVVIKPFILIEEFWGSYGLALVLINIYMLSFVALWKSFGKSSIWALFLIVLPYFVSVRTTICVISMVISYLSLFRRHKVSKVWLLVSMLLGNLSSGVLVNIIALAGWRFYTRDRKMFFVFIPFFLVIMSPMIASKLHFFAEIGNPLVTMIMRNNIISSIGVSYTKLALYFIICTLCFYVSILFLKIKNDLFILSLVGFVSVVLFEGLGAISIFPLILFVMPMKFLFFENNFEHYLRAK